MFTCKNLKLTIKVLALLLVAAISYFILKDTLPQAQFVQASLQSVEESRTTVMRFSAATLSASLAISALPDDFATPLAGSLADMNVYFVFILMVLFFEEVLLRSGMEAAFGIMIPVACVMTALSILVKRDMLRQLAMRIAILALAIAFVVPCNTYMSKAVGDEIHTYVEETIQETEQGVGKMDDVMKNGEDNKTIFEKLSDLFHTAIKGVSDLLTYIQNTIRKCLNAIAILIVTNFIMPLLTFFILKWVLKETFNIVLPSVPVPSLKPKKAAAGETSVKTECITAGEE